MKVAIVGVGHVGATLAYSLLEVETIDHLHLVGRDQGRLKGESLDLRHASSFFAAPQTITYSTVVDCHDAQIIVLTLSQPPVSADRSAQAVENGRLFAEVVPLLARQSPDAVFLVATNPVEALTQWTIELAGFEPGRVLGAGTIIDSCRFRAALSEFLHVHPEDLRAYVLGEHGDSQFLWLSGAAVGGVRLESADIPDDVIESTRSSGTDVFRLKGHTSYAISQALQLIIGSIAGDRMRTMPVSTQVDLGPKFPPLCLAIPCVVGRRGVERKLHPQFTSEEQEKWISSGHSVAATLRRIHDELG